MHEVEEGDFNVISIPIRIKFVCNIITFFLPLHRGKVTPLQLQKLNFFATVLNPILINSCFVLSDNHISCDEITSYLFLFSAHLYLTFKRILYCKRYVGCAILSLQNILYDNRSLIGHLYSKSGEHLFARFNFIGKSWIYLSLCIDHRSQHHDQPSHYDIKCENNVQKNY